MKTAILIVLFSVVAITVRSQQLSSSTFAKGKHTEFALKKDGNSLFIHDKNNPYSSKSPKIAPIKINIFKKRDESAVGKAFHEVFSDERLKQLLPESALLVNYYVDVNGDVKYTSFLTQVGTKLTTAELEQLQDALKKEVSFVLDPDETKGGDFFVFSQAVKYRKLLYAVQ